MIKLFGLKGCDTCREAVKNLKTENVGYEFFDLKKDGIELTELKEWLELAGSDVLLNKRGTTWRKLSDNEKAELNVEKISLLMLKYPALIKRPVFKIGKKLVVGYKDEQKKALGL